MPDLRDPEKSWKCPRCGCPREPVEDLTDVLIDALARIAGEHGHVVSASGMAQTARSALRTYRKT